MIGNEKYGVHVYSYILHVFFLVVISIDLLHCSFIRYLQFFKYCTEFYLLRNK